VLGGVTPGGGTFRSDQRGMDRLAATDRLLPVGKTLTFIRYLDDFAYSRDLICNQWVGPKIICVSTPARSMSARRTS
jgi:adenine-specific DNA-methyltransferase